MRQDVATGTLERAAPGKFVEALVQVLEFLEAGTYSAKPDVDRFLRSLESRPSTLDDGLRVCAARLGRAMYSLRSKRNIAHLAAIDPNEYDQRLLMHAAQWIVAELVRNTMSTTMDEAGALIEQLLVPVGGLVEDFGDKSVVIADMTIKRELRVLLHAQHPDGIAVDDLLLSMKRRRAGSVRRELRSLWRAKEVEEVAPETYRLTRLGFAAAVTDITAHVS